jgi:hypothetical protein
MIGVLSVIFSQSAYGQEGEDVADQNDVNSVIIALTRLDVNDLILDVNDQILDVNEQATDANDQALDVNIPTLELRYKIINNSSNDIWVCNSVGFIDDEFEVFMEDYQSLLIRRRLDVLALVIYYIWPEGQYVRLRAGKEMVKSLSITLPVHNHWIFVPRLERRGVTYARRLVLEIGYHTKDLAQIILDLKASNDDPNLYDKAIISYLHSANEGEHVLSVTVDGVLIPYEDMWMQDPHGSADAIEQSVP